MRALVQDVSFSLRSLQRSSGFALIAVLTLSLGIAAITAVFTIVDATLLSPLPYWQPDRLVIFQWLFPKGVLTRNVSAEAFFILKERASFFQSIAVHYDRSTGVNLSTEGPAQYQQAQFVSASFFHTLGVDPLIGRGINEVEDKAGGPEVVVLSYGLWRQDFNGDPGIVGHEVRINGKNHRIVGVMPKQFRSYPEANLWLPIRLSRATAQPGNDYQVIVRLKNGISLSQMQAELDATREYRAAFPAPSYAAQVRLRADELPNFLFARTRESLYRLFGAVMFVIFISCINLALLLTVRGAVRAREFAIRIALGSSRFRLVRVVLMDAILIALCSGVIGTILAKELLPVILWVAPSDLSLSGAWRVNAHVLVFTATISVAAALLSGLPPALRMSRVNLNDRIRRSSRMTGGSFRKTSLGGLLVPVQTGLALFLLTGAVALLHSFLQLQGTPAGFDPQHVFVAQISLGTPAYKSSAATSRLLDELTAQIRTLPGIESAGAVSGLPLEEGLTLGMVPADPSNKIAGEEIQYRSVSLGYFQVLRIGLIAGRLFTPEDVAGRPRVALVSEGLARQWWPDQSPLGRFITMDHELDVGVSEIPREVVGVVADVRESGLDRPVPPTVYVPVSQAPDALSAFVNPRFPASIVVRTTKDVDLKELVSQSLAVDDRDLAVISLRPLAQVLSASIARYRFYTSLITAFGAFAVLLTAIGLYGVLSYHLNLRLWELGLRIALGADRFQIIGMILRHGLGLVVIGIFFGSLASFFLSKSLAALIYNMPDTRSTSVSLAALLLLAIALVTSLLVSVRTVAIEPMEVLKLD